jgi:hypothetical protein
MTRALLRKPLQQQHRDQLLLVQVPILEKLPIAGTPVQGSREYIQPGMWRRLQTECWSE